MNNPATLRRHAAFFLGLALSGALLPLPAFAQHKTRLVHRERTLYEVPFEVAAAGSVVLSADGEHLAYVVRYDSDDDKTSYSVVADGVEGPGYQRIAPGTPVFSPDGSRCAYAGQREGRWRAVVDGEEQQWGYDRIWDGSLLFSPDSRHVAFVAGRKNSVLAVVDGREGRLFDDIPGEAIVFSPDSSRLAYRAVRDGQHYVVVAASDGTPAAEGFAYERVGPPVFSPDSLHVAHYGRREDHNVIVIDGEEQRAAGTVRPSSLVFIPDGGRRVAYVTGSAPKMRVAIAGGAPDEKHPAYDWVFQETLSFSADGKRLAYAARKDRHCFVVEGEKQGPDFDGIVAGSIAFSPDGTRLAYVAERGAAGGKVLRSVVVDGNAGKGYDRIRGNAAFSPDGTRVAYVAEVGTESSSAFQQFVVVEGTDGNGKPFSLEGPAYGWVRGQPAFSADGQRVALITMANHERFPAADEIPAQAGDRADAGVVAPGGAPQAGRRGRLVFDKAPDIPGDDDAARRIRMRAYRQRAERAAKERGEKVEGPGKGLPWRRLGENMPLWQRLKEEEEAAEEPVQILLVEERVEEE